MKDRFFLDTNIFAYSFDSDAPAKQKRARDLILHGIKTRKAVVSYQVVQEFFNLALRKFSHPMNIAEAEQYLQTIFQPLLAVQSSQTLFSQALRLEDKHRLSWCDALIVAAAVESQCAILYSEDMHDGHRFEELQIKNPFL
jgi:predicted nucleic acid-binding protein